MMMKMMMRRISIALVAMALLLPGLRADEGMWMLPFLKQQNLAKMQAMGMQMSAEDIYNPGEGSLIDAVVHFGGGCTGEIVSSSGLVLTNHHCGYGQIQNHSTVEDNYLRDGFYAPTLEDELPNPGLTVTLIEEIIDATSFVEDYLVRHNITDPLQYLRRGFLREIAEHWYQEERGALPSGTELDLAPFYEGNRYYLFIKKVYSDVRLVAAPPSCIGKFGADTDNWAWPRHSGDFSVFRVYTAPDGSPAKYSAENIPLRPKHYLKINGSGVQENDFVMMVGFPGTTNHFYTPAEVEERRDIDNQIRIDMREVRQNALWEEMMKDEAINIQYANKYQGSTNAYKNAIGTNWAINKLDFASEKALLTEKLRDYAIKNNKPEYIEAIENITRIVEERSTLRTQSKILDEGVWRAIEIAKAPLLSPVQYAKAQAEPEELEKWLDTHYERYFNKDYNVEVDKKVTKAMLHQVTDALSHTAMLEDCDDPAVRFIGLFDAIDPYVDHLFATTAYRSRETLAELIQSKSYDEYLLDPVVRLGTEVRNDRVCTSQRLAAFDRDFALARQTYLKGILEMEGELNIWPDANSTIRYTYGKVKGYAPRDAVYYTHQTTMEGIMEKQDDESPEFYLLPEVVDMYQRQNFGNLALPDGRMPVNFIATTHTTGGNSGSPLVNAKGELVGINFDRNWEGVGGDIMYLPDYQRSIIVDVRYVLLILQDYLRADRLMDELEITFD